MPHINDAGLTILKRFEGCVLTAYRDVAEVLTIGYGHTGDDVKIGDCIDQDRADALLKADLHSAETSTQALVEVLLNPNQFSALVCFVYNVGEQAFSESTMRRLVNSNDFAGASHQFDRWVYAGGRVQPGLVARRQAEKALFLEPWSPEPARTAQQPHKPGQQGQKAT